MLETLKNLIGRPFGVMRAAGVPDEIRMFGKQMLFTLMNLKSRPTGLLTRYGATGAPWFLRADLLGKSPHLISAGLSDDIKFEEEFLAKHSTGTLLGIDPTPLCAPLMHDLEMRFKGRVTYRREALGGENSEKEIFAQIGLDGEVNYFYWALPPGASRMNLVKKSLTVVGIGTLLAEHGSTVDLLKIDIEGAEYDLLSMFPKLPTLPRQLLVEFHYRFDSYSLRQTKSLIGSLERLGYRLEWMSDWREEFLFVHQR